MHVKSCTTSTRVQIIFSARWQKARICPSKTAMGSPSSSPKLGRRASLSYADCAWKAASAAVTMAKDGVASLELVATLPAFRRRGYARAVCHQAVMDEWARGTSLVTVRAVNVTAARLYQQLGFRSYNHAL